MAYGNNKIEKPKKWFENIDKVPTFTFLFLYAVFW